jgi:hypothetical protein
LTSPWIGVEHGAAGRGFGDRVRDRLRAQPDTSFQMIRNARDRGIAILSGSDTGNASAFNHGKARPRLSDLELALGLCCVIDPRTPTLSLQAPVCLRPGWRFIRVLNPMDQGGLIAPLR